MGTGSSARRNGELQSARLTILSRIIAFMSEPFHGNRPVVQYRQPVTDYSPAALLFHEKKALLKTGPSDRIVRSGLSL
jgi:hypothetical protein